MNSQPARLTQGPVGRHLVNMAVPVLFGIATLMAQSFIDAYFLGMVGDRALAAFSFGFPILMIVTSVAIGLGARRKAPGEEMVGEPVELAAVDDGWWYRLGCDGFAGLARILRTNVAVNKEFCRFYIQLFGDVFTNFD